MESDCPISHASPHELLLGLLAVLDEDLGLPYQPYSTTSIISKQWFFEVQSIYLFQDQRFTTGIIASETVFYYSQYFKAPTRVASWVYYFYILACHVIILLYLRTFTYFNKRHLPLCTLSSWLFIL